MAGDCSDCAVRRLGCPATQVGLVLVARGVVCQPQIKDYRFPIQALLQSVRRLPGAVPA